MPLKAPAAMARGNGENEHGDPIDGRNWFRRTDDEEWPGGQKGVCNDKGSWKLAAVEITCAQKAGVCVPMEHLELWDPT